MAANWRKTVIGLSALFIHPIWATQYASWAFYDNECYGTAYSPTFAMDFLGNTNEYTFPGGHFVDVGDGCGPGNCFAITYTDECHTCLVDYGTGCYNVDLGWEPTNFVGWCAPCNDVPAAGCTNTCF
jgi:hypothetical protein